MMSNTLKFSVGSVNTPHVPFDRIAAMPNRLLCVSLIAENQRIKQIRAILGGNSRASITLEGDNPTHRDKGYKSKMEAWQSALSQESDGYHTYIHKIGYGQSQAVFVARRAGFLPVATPESIWRELSGDRYTTPILREWMPYVESKIREYGYFKSCFCVGCNAGILDPTDAQLDAIIRDGIQAGHIAIPRGQYAPASDGQLPAPLASIGSMDAYLDSYGPVLGRKAADSLVPLHRPGIDPLPDLSRSMRKPYAAQHHVVAAGIEMLKADGGGFIAGEMGTGKTLIGMLISDELLRRPSKRGRKPRGYRALVVCPDHLIDKWGREIRQTIPGAVVRDFDDWRDILSLLDLRRPQADPNAPARWEKPVAPEWYVVGQNQIKWNPDWEGISAGSGDRLPISRRKGRNGNPLIAAKYATLTQCSKCGTVVRDRQKIAVSPGEIAKRQRRCDGRYLAPFADPMQPDLAPGSGDVWPLPQEYEEKSVGSEVLYWGRSYVIGKCGEPLWNYTSSPYRWPMAKIIHKKLKRFFTSVIIDEAHAAKSDASAQSMAVGKLIASTRYALAMTGTIIGGYANHIYPLLYRINGRSLRAEGFEWGKDLAFSEAYGRVDRIISTTETLGIEIGSSSKAMGREIVGKSSERKAVRPGIMPTLFGRHLISSSVFITLNEMAADLPTFTEFVSSPIRSPDTSSADPFLFDVVCEMEPDQQAEYDRIAEELASANTALMQRNSQKLLGAYLWTLLDYPDRPWGWDHPAGLIQQMRAHGGPDILIPETVGWWDGPSGDRHWSNWRGVVSPIDLPKGIIYPKEQRMIDIVKTQYNHGSQTWIYAQMTNKRDIQPRLAGLLHNEGLRVGILRARDVKVREREQWINRNGHKYDVIISHPQLVCTGLELFAQGRHNYSTILFYQAGYNPFVMAQAARRAWRIGQQKACRVYYLYYHGSMGHKAIKLMSLKAAASKALEGRFTLEGLAAMSGDVSIQMALAKGLADKISDEDMRRNWERLSSPSPGGPGAYAAFGRKDGMQNGSGSQFAGVGAGIDLTGQQYADPDEEFDF